MDLEKYKVIFEFESWKAYEKFLIHYYSGIDRIQEAMEVEGGMATFTRMQDFQEIIRYKVGFKNE